MPKGTPPKRLAFAIRNYGLDRIPVLDVGCGRGEYLAHLGPGSVGLDLDPTRALEAGLDARRWNFTDGIPQEFHGQFGAIWCSNLLEHVLAPHEFLIQLRAAAADPCHLFIAVPHTTRYRGRSWRDYLAADHINFFTPRTLYCTLERAGYAIKFLGAPSVPALPPRIATRLAPVAPTLMAIASVNLGFQYPEKAHKVLSDGHIVFKGPVT